MRHSEEQQRLDVPYGGERGTPPAAWPSQKGFVGGDIDKTTSLTHIGARDYGTKLGQFISVDPLLSLDQPQSLNGYDYANNSPVTNSDPTGERNEDVVRLPEGPQHIQQHRRSERAHRRRQRNLQISAQGRKREPEEQQQQQQRGH
ncbi:RHS repeat domain-containing protein [Streptomyces goshikiensis]|uniref:RHS repeat domain-containing protein n=1 Tax=Streptomyces goshikiensis TaxID=1942 RepID=UPI0037AF15E4